MESDQLLQEYSATQLSFDEVIDCLPAYGPALATIKAEYEQVMDTVTRAQRQGQLKQLRKIQTEMEHLTIRNFYDRKNELETRLAHLRIENNRIKDEIRECRDEQDLIRRKAEEELKAREKANSQQVTSSERRLLRLRVEEATDLDCLEKELQRMKTTLDEVQANTDRRHVPVSDAQSLQHSLDQKENTKSREEKQNRYLGHLSLQLKAVITAVSSSSSLSMTRESLMKLIKLSLDNLASQDVEGILQDRLEEDCNDNEAELTHTCCEKFNKLFSSAQYKEAAMIAASAPQGILRTEEIFAKFSSVSTHDLDSSSHPLLLYCDALVQTSPVFGGLSTEETVRCVRCALQCGQQQRVAHWITMELISTSCELGWELYRGCTCDHWCSCGCVGLAEVTFEDSGAPYEVAVCLAKQRKFSALKWLLMEKKMSKESLSRLIVQLPEYDLVSCLVSSCSVSLFEAIWILANSDRLHECKQLFDQEIARKEEIKSFLESSNQVSLAASLLEVLSRKPSPLAKQLASDVQALLAMRPATTDVDNTDDVAGPACVSTPSLSSQLSSSCYTTSQSGYNSSNEQYQDTSSSDDDTDT